MSLTNPVLNDILIKEIKELKEKLNRLENDIMNKIDTNSYDIGSFNAKLIKQDCKVDIIHKLFNSVKNTKDDTEIVKDHVYTKKLYSEIENSINDKYALFVEKVMSIITQYTTQQEHNMVNLNQNYNNVNFNLNDIRDNMTSITKSFNDMSFRVDSLEKSIRKLEYQLSGINNKDCNQMVEKNTDINYNYNDDRDNNWIKVVKGKRNNKNYYQNRY